MAMTLVSTVTVGSGGSLNIEWASIPQTGKDLLVLFSGRVNVAGLYDQVQLYFNNDTNTANYSGRVLRGLPVNSSVSSYSDNIPNEGVVGNTAASNIFGIASFYVSNYTSSAAKSVSSESVWSNNTSAGELRISAWRWSGTSAITTLDLNNPTASFMQYSTASLYIIS